MLEVYLKMQHLKRFKILTNVFKFVYFSLMMLFISLGESVRFGLPAVLQALLLLSLMILVMLRMPYVRWMGR